MTVQSNLSRVDYAGNGVTTTPYPVPFRFLRNTDVKVLRTVIATNVTTTLILDSLGVDGFSIVGAGKPSGGTVSVVTAPAVGERLSILRDMPFTQVIDYISNDAFPAESHESGLDERVMENQQLREIVSRAVVLSPQTVGVSNELPGPVALNLLRWKADLSGIENAAPPAIATVADGAVVDATVSPIAGIQASKLAFQQAGAGAVTRTVQDKDRDIVSVKDFGAVGNGIADDTLAIQSALNTGKSVSFVEGATYLATGLTLSTSGVILSGRATIKKKGAPNAILLTITGSFNVVDGIRFDGTAAGQAVGQINDIIRVHTTASDNVIKNCYINTSAGGGISVLNSARNKILFNTVYNTRDNNILVANVGANDNLVHGNYCDTTNGQNNIFLTADSSSFATTDFIYRNIVSNNICVNSSDTAIEIGQHNVGATVIGNIALGAVNPPILLRDSVDFNVVGNTVQCLGCTDGIATVNQNEPTSFPARGSITGNHVFGRPSRSFIYMSQDSVRVSDNYITDTITVVNAGGTNLVGSGILVAGSIGNLDLRNNSIENVSVGINTGFVPATNANLICTGNRLSGVGTGLFMNGGTITAGKIADNTFTKVVTTAISLTSATGSFSTLMARNNFNLTGYTGATPVKFTATYAVLGSFLSSELEQAAAVPVVAFDQVLLIPIANISAGILSLEFANGDYAIMSIYPQAGTGDGISYTFIKNSATVNNNVAGFADWGVTKAGNGIILQRRGGTIGSVGNFKWTYSAVTNSI